MTDQIARHRKRIDELDAEILQLIEERVAEAIRIRQLKLDSGIPLFTPEREQVLIKTLVERSAGTLTKEVIEDIWKTIIKGGKRTSEIR